MKIGVGLPSNVPGVRPADVIDWARRAEELGFDELIITDRFAWDQLDPLAVVATAAAVTERVTLRLSVLLLPSRLSAGMLAKQLATLSHLSEGRLVLGVGVGDREVDYRLAGAQHKGRHAMLEEMLTEIRAIWAGTDPERALIGPRIEAGDIPIQIGGNGPNTWRRIAQHGDGWTMAVGTPESFAAGVAAIEQTWAEHGREGRPTFAAQRYFSIGAEARAGAEAYLREYFAFLGPWVDGVVQSAPLDEESVRAVTSAFDEAGADQLAFIPTSTSIDQLDRLAKIVVAS